MLKIPKYHRGPHKTPSRDTCDHRTRVWGPCVRANDSM